MTDDLIEITCVRCNHPYYVNLSDLDRKDVVLYKEEVQWKKYRARCPECGTYNVFTVEFQEEDDDQSTSG